tara:strand:- start:503 stop:664 length:162 start_codon:yes stop_codon:yes gene_type:complete
MVLKTLINDANRGGYSLFLDPGQCRAAKGDGLIEVHDGLHGLGAQGHYLNDVC